MVRSGWQVNGTCNISAAHRKKPLGGAKLWVRRRIKKGSICIYIKHEHCTITIWETLSTTSNTK